MLHCNKIVLADRPRPGQDRVGRRHAVRFPTAEAVGPVVEAGAVRPSGALFVETTREPIEMRCSVQWLGDGGMSFVAETGSGHLVTMDGAPDGGGRNLAPRPMEMLLVGAGGCTAYDVVTILKRGRHRVSGCSVAVDAERAAADPKVFTRIALHFVVRGRGLPPAAVERAIALSHEKYCSATIMLARTAQVSVSHEVVDDDAPVAAASAVGPAVPDAALRDARPADGA